jgi:probable H4MPT-linked C1 transfer pathway protein
VLGLDIGGANIKAATSDGDCVSRAFAIWQHKDALLQELMQLPELSSKHYDLVALTMTAELADCFENKSEGVEFIVRTVAEAFPDSVLRVWTTSGEFVEPGDAVDLSNLVAAGNWHALATWAGRAVPVGPGLLIDIGSTTTDVIPLCDGIPVPEGFTDLHRLAYSELIYSGVRRTPVCAMVSAVPLAGPPDSETLHSPEPRFIPVAAEYFATSLDVHLVNGQIQEDPQDQNTADHNPATRNAALNRLARMVCCDREEIADDALEYMAQYIGDRQRSQISSAIDNRLQYLSHLTGTPPEAVQLLLSGSGDWLADRVLAEMSRNFQLSPIRLRSMFIRNVSEAACAFAVARLAAERCLADLLPIT